MKGDNTNMHYGASHLIFKRAEELRKFTTHEEEIVWGYLKGNQLGVKFRRQHPVLFYIADFYCHTLKLVIEIDGSVHNKTDVKITDAIRQKKIEDLGIKVIRFTNQQVKNSPENILEKIIEKITELKTSKEQSSHSGAGGRHAIIFSAGLGTRFKPWTDRHPKALAMVNGKSLLQRNIEYLQQYNIYDVVVNVHHFPQQIIDAIHENKGWGSNIIISDESNEVLETGGGLLKAKALFEKEDFFISLNVDVLTDLDINKLIAFHREQKALISFGVTDRKTSRNILLDEKGRMCGWKNNTTGEEKIKIIKDNLQPFAYSCVVVYKKEVFSKVKQTGKFSIMDTYLDLAADNLIMGYNHSGDKWVDVGRPESVAIAENLFD
jgi:MurNAc alpha-1-phosphate uridylyltransferase